MYFSEDPKLDSYLEAHHSAESDLLADLNRQTHLKVLQPCMLSGALQGRFLALISKMLRPRFVLEIGTYTGYSALCLAEGLEAEGELHSLEINDELENFIQHFWSRSEFEKQLHLHIGNALEILANLNFQWDLVFIDAEKTEYAEYYDLIVPRLKSGAVVIVDNVLWSGKVLDDVAPGDDTTQALIDFNKKVQDDERVENLLIPMRDGLMVLRVK